MPLDVVVVCKCFLIMVEFLIQNMDSYTNVAPETSQTLFRRLCLVAVDWLQ